MPPQSTVDRRERRTSLCVSSIQIRARRVGTWGRRVRSRFKHRESATQGVNPSKVNHSASNRRTSTLAHVRQIMIDIIYCYYYYYYSSCLFVCLLSSGGLAKNKDEAHHASTFNIRGVCQTNLTHSSRCNTRTGCCYHRRGFPPAIVRGGPGPA